jgi:SAM-dependent methyltransferase
VRRNEEERVDDVEGAKTFSVDGDSYDRFMGRYSAGLAASFADAAGVTAGHSALDVGCGPGALTRELVDRLGSDRVAACDPSPAFVVACSERFPEVDVRPGRAEELPFESGTFDHALAQLVLHFVSEPDRAVDEMRRVVRPGGTVAACVWDFADGMEMLRAFWDAAVAIEPDAPDEAGTLRFGGPREIAELFVAGGLDDVHEVTLTTSSRYESFDELWAGFLAGIGPAGAYCVGLDSERRERLRSTLFDRLGSPEAGFTLGAVARCAVGRVGG